MCAPEIRLSLQESKRRAFTLVELLVVIAVIGMLVALLLPALQSVRASARSSVCKSNMRQVALGLLTHHESHKRFPAGWQTDDDTDPEADPGWGWAAKILPFMEQDHLTTQIRFDLPISDVANQSVRESVVPPYLCASDDAPNTITLMSESSPGTPLFNVARANYVGVFGTEEIEDDPSNGNGTFYHNSFIRQKQMADGASYTMIVGERSSRNLESTWVGFVADAEEAMARVVGSTDHVPNHKDTDGTVHPDDFSSDHPHGANFVFGDLSTRTVPNTIALSVYKALATRSGKDGGHSFFLD